MTRFFKETENALHDPNSFSVLKDDDKRDLTSLLLLSIQECTSIDDETRYRLFSANHDSRWRRFIVLKPTWERVWPYVTNLWVSESGKKRTKTHTTQYFLCKFNNVKKNGAFILFEGFIVT
jgi:hypothetical protein